MHASAAAPSIRLTVAAVAQVSGGTCINTVAAVMSMLLLMACLAFMGITAYSCVLGYSDSLPGDTC